MMQSGLARYFWTLFCSQVAHSIVTLRQSCPKFRVKMILLVQHQEPKRKSHSFSWWCFSLPLPRNPLSLFLAESFSVDENDALLQQSERKGEKAREKALPQWENSMARKPETKLVNFVMALLNFLLYYKILSFIKLFHNRRKLKSRRHFKGGFHNFFVISQGGWLSIAEQRNF